MTNEKKKETPEERRERLLDVMEEIDDTYIYVKYLARFYWLEQKKFFHINDVANNLLRSAKVLNELRDDELMDTYDNVCYRKG